MLAGFNEISEGLRYSGIVAGDDVTVLAVTVHGPTSASLVYRGTTGLLGECVLSLDQLSDVSLVADRRWTFDADGAMFRLASEARRMKWAHLANPFTAVDAANIDPYPHQIDAVYNRFLEQRPLRFVLADDPGAGKTIMSGLLIQELVLRGDLARCLIVAPGSLVEQWQDELWEKFGLEFEIMSRGMVEAARTGNPFLEKNMLIARVDQLSRADDLIAKLKLSDWDLVIVDEAHKMSAHLYGNELKKTKRFALGEVLREQTRHFLLLTATPHNGKNEDFLVFMSLIDPERFTGRLRNDQMPDVKDVMRRLVKENLVTFDGKRIFPPRYAHTVSFELSELEQSLYDAVTEYVKQGMNRADQMSEAGDKRRGNVVGFALAGLQRRLASSPEAIFQSLRRRHERLTLQLEELKALANRPSGPQPAAFPQGLDIPAPDDFDYDDYDDAELEALEDEAINAATLAANAEELEAELIELAELVSMAGAVRDSGVDTKWVEMRNLLRSDEFQHGVHNRKLIVFSEHKDTLNYVADRIRNELGRPETVEVIHGSMKRESRREVQDRFRVDPTVRVLVATDAAGEGVNLQVANLMVNYDLPWNPNRIEQRFGRIHRIGQKFPCHLWNMVAHTTREGKVFERLFQKIEQQRGIYGDQVYDVLGMSHINVSLHELLLRAILEDEEAARLKVMDEVINDDIGEHLKAILDERALVAGLATGPGTEEIRDLMESAKARRLQPWFVFSFFEAALQLYGGRIVKRETDRYEITRVPATIRSHATPGRGPVHDRYSRVTFDKRAVQPDGLERAELISPGNPLLGAIIETVLSEHGDSLVRGSALLDPTDPGTQPRLLVYLDHVITDGRLVHGHRQVVSRRFEYVEVNSDGHVVNPGPEPYLGYAPLTEDQRTALSALDIAWANVRAEEVARDWAIEHFANPHLTAVSALTYERVGKVRAAVNERLVKEIQFWDRRCEEIKQQELVGKTPALNSGRARARADELEARRDRRLRELDQEENLQSSLPTIVGAALIIPQGLLDQMAGIEPVLAAQPNTEETDRRAVAAVVEAEQALGRVPEVMAHNNPGFDIESIDPETGTHYFIEVKGHLPQTTEIKVSAQQVQKAKSNPERWRLAVVSVPTEQDRDPSVRYLIDPFRNTYLHFAQTHVPLNVSALLQEAGDPS